MTDIDRRVMAAAIAEWYCRPDSDRRAVTIAEWNNRPDELADEYAYWYDEDVAELGFIPWRLVEGVEARARENLYDADFVNGGFKTVLGSQEIYVRSDHFALLNLGRP